jgi:hypothetical protein
VKTPQTFNDEELGGVQFFDRKETIHSAKCKVADIQLVDKYDRATAARLKRDITDDINAHR